MTALPSRFTVTCRADGEPAKDIPVGVTLHMMRRNHYFVIAGKTTADGTLEVYKDALVREANATRDLFPLDYEPLEGSSGEPNQFAGRIEVAALTVSEIEAALRAYDLYHAATTYPPLFRTTLEAGHRALTALAPRRMEVSVAQDPPTQGVSFDTASVPYPVTSPAFATSG